MARVLLVAFIATPLIEIALFIQAGALIGLWPTIALVVLTAIIGTTLLRAQGLQTLETARREMAQGGVPVGALFDGLCLLIAGALLLTPGFFTDALGFALMVPALRQAVGRWAIARLTPAAPRTDHPDHPAATPPDAIDVAWEDLPPDDRDSKPGS